MGQPAAHAVSADPFAAVRPVMPAQEVRLVFDDKDVSDAEVGRKAGGKVAVASLAIAGVGMLVGWFVGSTWRENDLYKRASRDASEVYGSVNSASATVEKARNLIDKAVKSAAPAPGKGIEMDFASIDELRKLPKPFPADVFSRKLYNALEPATVDALFSYYNNTNLLWAKITTVANKSLPAARDNLSKAAKAAGDLATTEFGCVPAKDGENFSCGLVTVQHTDDGKIAAVLRGNSYPKTPYAGQDLASKTSDYVIMIDKSKSNDVLGAPTNLFQSFARDLMEAKTLADQTLELQGRLIQQLGAVAKNVTP